MARDPLKPYREAGAALVGEVQERLGEARDHGKSAAKQVVKAVQREVTEPLASRAVATKADLARLEARIEALERALGRSLGTKVKTGPKKAGAKKAASKPATKTASSPHSSQ
jgi:polyhydroxyalkanoate synthesis regulator phasin